MERWGCIGDLVKEDIFTQEIAKALLPHMWQIIGGWNQHSKRRIGNTN
jgi:hypothetical protein